MTGKERVKKALDFEMPDLIPYGEYGIDCDVASRVLGRETYLRNKAASIKGLWEGRRNEVVQSWKEDLVELSKKLGLDIIVATMVPSKHEEFENPKKIDEGTYEFKNGEIVKYSSITNDFVVVKRAVVKEDIKEEEPLSREIKIDDSEFEFIDYVVEKLGQELYIVGTGNNTAMAKGLDGMVIFSGDMENNLLDAIMNPDLVKKKTEEKTFTDMHYNLEICKRGVDAIIFGPDLAYNSGPFISPEMFRELCAPYFKKHVDFIHKNTGKKVIKHSCGNNWKLMDDFIDIGFDCYQAIQTSAGMDIKLLKEKYYRKIALWGGLQVENLVLGDKNGIKSDIEYAIQYGAPGGGFILGSSNSIAYGTDYDTYMYALDMINKYRSI